MSDLAPDSVEPRLRGRFGRPYLYVVETPSTQELFSEVELPEGAVAVAEHQTAGRGRSGRTWSDTAGRALLCSVLLRPAEAPVIPQLSLVVGLATAEAIEALAGVSAALKWPNDVLLDGRKVAGVLLERRGSAVVCGIGINVGQERHELPDDTRVPATSLRVASADAHDRGALLVELLDGLEQLYGSWTSTGLEPLVERLASRDALRGRRITLSGSEGVGAGFSADGRLIVRSDDGATHLVSSGEIGLA